MPPAFFVLYSSGWGSSVSGKDRSWKLCNLFRLLFQFGVNIFERRVQARTQSVHSSNNCY